MQKSDLPFGSEFSPSQIVLSHVLDLAQQYSGNWRAFEDAVREVYFSKNETSDFNKGKLANNTKLGMIAYGLIDRDVQERGTKSDGRGAKPFLVSPTEKLKKDLVLPLLRQLEQQVGAELIAFQRKRLATIREEIKVSDTYIRGLALEALAFKLMRLLDLDYVATRLRGTATGGAEVDVLFESSRLVYCRWQVQCENTNRVTLDDVAKEVGLTHLLKSNVIDIGGAWIAGQPTRSLYHFKLLIMLCEEFGFHLAQEFYWWNPSKLPTPAEWVTVRRIRVKDAINCMWWLSPSPWPRSSNKRVLQPYSSSMKDLLKNGYHAQKRPSGHDISKKFAIDNGAAIPPNLIALANTESNSFYLRYCRERGIKPHPARYPSELPEYFIRMLTDVNDLVVDPFAGSCMTGEVCERLKRRWTCIEVSEEYVKGALGRFARKTETMLEPLPRNKEESDYYKLARPGILWNGVEESSLPSDGGQTRVYGETPIDASITSLYSEETQPTGNYLRSTGNSLWGEFNEDEEGYVVGEESQQDVND